MILKRLLIVLALLALLASCSEEAPREEARSEVTLTEWLVPWEASRPRDPFVETPNKIWFVGQRDGYLAYFNPALEEFTQIQLAEGSGPHNIIVDDEGTAWYAGNVMGWIGRFTPDGGLTTIQMPEDAADPHTLIEDGQGNIWFTSQGANSVGLLNKKDLTVRIFPVQTPGARPYGITVDRDGRPWIALFGTNKIATIDPETGIFSEIELPRTGARPRRIEATSDGMIWYVDYTQGYLGRYDPDDGDFKEWAMPGGAGSQPYGMAVDARDRIWFVEVGPQPNRFIGFDPEIKSFFSITEIKSGGGAVRHMMYHAPTNTIWFGTDANTLGRAELPD
jgi:virginiamycin B lyase